MSLFAELKRRNVVRVAIAYVVLSWLLLQVADTLGDTLALPEWTGRMVVLLIAIGFIPALIFSWVYELTPEGIKKESEIDRSNSITTTTGRKLDIAVLVMLVAVVALYFVDPRQPTQPVNPASQPATDLTPTASTSKPSAIAVLPFLDLSPDNDQGYFADGIAEEILNLLARNPDLRVIARTSAFKFRGEDHDLREVGQALNANRILEGSVRTAGSRVRITAQLIDSESNLHLWSETYDRELTDIFAVQDEIARSISDALGVHLGVSLASASTIIVDAYHLYLQGKKAFAKSPGGVDSIARAGGCGRSRTGCCFRCAHPGPLSFPAVFWCFTQRGHGECPCQFRSGIGAESGQRGCPGRSRLLPGQPWVSVQ
jgi:TolB-like protein